ncbi:MAG: aliphatic sulfonate ABC transporter substrate-binding protein [Phormidium sp.]
MKFHQIYGWLTILLVSLIVTVNCSPSPNPNVTNSPPSITRKLPIKMGVNTWPPSLNWEIAQQSEIFSANQVEVDLKYYDYLRSVQKLTQGELDANYQTLSDTIIALAAPAAPDLVVVLAADSSNGGDAIVVGPGINSIADLKGKKIATEEGGIDHFLLLFGLNKAGIKPEDITIENLDLRAAVATFVEGQIDAVAVYIPYTKEALKRPGSKILFSSRDFPQTIPSHLVVNRKLIDERPEDVQALVKSWFDTLNVIRQNPEQSYQIMADYLGVSLAEFKSYNSQVKFFSLAENFKSFMPGSDLKSLPYAAEQFSDFLWKNRIIKKRPDLSRLFDDSFVKAYSDSLKNS